MFAIDAFNFQKQTKLQKSVFIKFFAITKQIPNYEYVIYMLAFDFL